MGVQGGTDGKIQTGEKRGLTSQAVEPRSLPRGRPGRSESLGTEMSLGWGSGRGRRAQRGRREASPGGSLRRRALPTPPPRLGAWTKDRGPQPCQTPHCPSVGWSWSVWSGPQGSGWPLRGAARPGVAGRGPRGWAEERTAPLPGEESRGRGRVRGRRGGAGLSGLAAFSAPSPSSPESSRSSRLLQGPRWREPGTRPSPALAARAGAALRARPRVGAPQVGRPPPTPSSGFEPLLRPVRPAARRAAHAPARLRPRHGRRQLLARRPPAPQSGREHVAAAQHRGHPGVYQGRRHVWLLPGGAGRPGREGAGQEIGRAGSRPLGARGRHRARPATRRGCRSRVRR